MNLTFKNGDFELGTTSLMTRREFSEEKETLAELDKRIEDLHLGNIVETEKIELKN
jgi:DNA-directed RNA polymerase beta' subunit